MPRPAANGLSAMRMKDLARKGAAQLLQEMRADMIAIERTFPELALPQTRRRARVAVAQATRRAKRMSAAARKAVSERMTKYWAERRKAKARVR